MRRHFLVSVLSLAPALLPAAEPVPAIERAWDGGAQVSLFSDPDSYYVLLRSEDLRTPGRPMALALGDGSRITLLDPRMPLSQGAYFRIRQVPKNAPVDSDGDKLDDLAEFTKAGPLRALNRAVELPATDARLSITTMEEFMEMSVTGETRDTQKQPERFGKFAITSDGAVYFFNPRKYPGHPAFFSAHSRKDPLLAESKNPFRGEIIIRPDMALSDGNVGLYTFQSIPNDALPYDKIRAHFEVLQTQMPITRGRLAFFAYGSSLSKYTKDKALYQRGKLPVVVEKDLFKAISFKALNYGEGYGRLVVADPEKRPSPFEVVIYRDLPNDVPLMRGIITEALQTPLSHVNLRAVQNRIPNAFIKEATTNPIIQPLLGKWVRYEVSATGFAIHEVAKEDALAHLDKIRPTEPQSPPLNLAVQAVTSLDEIVFADASAFGAKAANVGEMRHWASWPGLSYSPIPSGYAVPFYFYDQFMRHNGFPAEIQQLLDDPEFQADADYRSAALEDLQSRIKKAPMPPALLDALARLQSKFPAGASIRCRSSTNNEDLPGYNGAGLYDSFTHHADEGHLGKTIRQVYASLWNINAFEQRDFYRVDHTRAAMGVLVHVASEKEKANGVAASKDIFFGVEYHENNKVTNSQYINVQLGEALVTNPEGNAVPEEILVINSGTAILRVTTSSLVTGNTRILSDAKVRQLRLQLSQIHNLFQGLYGRKGDKAFAMEIEFKIEADDTLRIKQARPWVD